MKEQRHENALAREESPYLLQHAHNPVNWLPWGPDALQLARDKNKLILVSIGYSTCHWCHVMERECFEDEEVAALMNARYVSIKVDREERPDVDQVYMNALQAMRRMGGWPLNCVATPEGKPVYGGTYFPKTEWMDILGELADMWRKAPEKMREYGDKLAAGLEVQGALPLHEGSPTFDHATLERSVANWSREFDRIHGGPDRAPKFPLPGNVSFLMHYASVQNDQDVAQHVALTLDRMALGGIHDHIGGGFARYSTDTAWKVPHFEKMLYDNAQLLALYSRAHAAFDKEEYRFVAQGIKRWLAREMKHPNGGYYSATDADSEGVEGKYYVWDPDFGSWPQAEAKGFERFYHTDDKARWEGKLIPVRRGRLADMAAEAGVSEEVFTADFHAANQALYALRENRVRPHTDTKRICSWNALLARGFADAYRYGKDPEDLHEAKSILSFIERDLTDGETGALSHIVKTGTAAPASPGFLEDYAFTAEAYIALYTVEFDEAALHRARALCFEAIDRFYDDPKGLFFIVDRQETELIARPTELADNVMPSANAVMAENLVLLGMYFDIPRFTDIAHRLVQGVAEAMTKYGQSYSRWADLYLRMALGTPEMTIAGRGAQAAAVDLTALYAPGVAFSAAENHSELSAFEHRLGRDGLHLYFCRNRSCQRPVTEPSQAIEQIRSIYSPL